MSVTSYDFGMKMKSPRRVVSAGVKNHNCNQSPRAKLLLQEKKMINETDSLSTGIAC